MTARIIFKGPESMEIYIAGKRLKSGPISSQKVKSKGKVRHLESPPLKCGKTYIYYAFIFEKPIDYQRGPVNNRYAYREIEIRAGGTYIIELTDKDFRPTQAD